MEFFPEMILQESLGVQDLKQDGFSDDFICILFWISIFNFQFSMIAGRMCERTLELSRNSKKWERIGHQIRCSKADLSYTGKRRLSLLVAEDYFSSFLFLHFQDGKLIKAK